MNGEKLKDKEREIIGLINSLNMVDGKIKEYPKEMSGFDAYNKKCIVEIKDRERYYNEPVIEFGKYCFNTQFAKLKSLNSFYVCRMEGYLYRWDLLYLKSINYNFKWHWRWMPQTTEFGKTEKVEKYVGYVNVRDGDSFEAKLPTLSNL